LTLSSAENLAIGIARSVWLRRDDKLAGKTFVLDHLITKKLCKSLSGADRGRFLSSVLHQRLGYATVLGNEFDEFLVGQCVRLAIQDMEPLIREV
jgi:hypothetical protein